MSSKLRFFALTALTVLLLSPACRSGAPRTVEDLDADDFLKAFALTELDDLPRARNLRADHYPASNERRIDLFEPKIRDLRGGYVGVGTDQNLTFLAWAKSDYAYLMDFDPVVVMVNKIHLHFIEISPTFEEYKALWDRRKQAESLEIVKRRFQNTPDAPLIEIAWKTAHRGGTDVPDRLNDLVYMEKKFGLKTFSNDPLQYTYIRTMIQKGRIMAVGGDLTGTKTLHSIAAAVRRIGIPIRVLYMSNAEEYFRYPDTFRSNIIDLPVDSTSLVVRTATSGAKYEFGYPPGEKFEDIPFHYNLQPVQNLQAWMKFRRYQSILTIVRARTTISPGFSIVAKTPQEFGLQESGDVVKKPPGEW